MHHRLNTIMLLDVCSRLQPCHHAFIRSAGTTGYQLYRELIDAGRYVDVYGEVVVVTATTTVSSSSSSSQQQREGVVTVDEDEGYLDDSSCLCLSEEGYEYVPILNLNCPAISTDVPSSETPHTTTTTILPSTATFTVVISERACNHMHDGVGSGSSVLTQPIHTKHAVRFVFDDDSSRQSSQHSLSANTYYKCLTVTSMDLSTFSSISAIGINFLSNCSKLTSLDMSEMRCISSIGSEFLSNATSLTSILLPPALLNTRVGRNFLVGCSKLTSIDVTPLGNIEYMGAGFMGRSGLQSIDLSPLSNTTFGEAILYECLSLVSITFPRCKGGTLLQQQQQQLTLPLTSLIKSTSTTAMPLQRGKCYTPLNVASSCRQLQHVDLSHLEVDAVNKGFLTWNSSLPSIDLTPLHFITSIGDEFLYGCTSLTAIDLSPLVSIQRIGSHFMASCRSLAIIDLAVIFGCASRVQHVGTYFLAYCTSLERVLNLIQNKSATPSSSSSSSPSLMTSELRTIGVTLLHECNDEMNLTADTFRNGVRGGGNGENISSKKAKINFVDDAGNFCFD